MAVSPSGSRLAVFVDKDGTLVEDVPYNVDPERIRLTALAGEGLRLLSSLGYRLVVVSNQSGVARGYFPESALATLSRVLRSRLEREGVALTGVYCCPHHPEGSVPRYARACECRKPRPGLLRRAARDLDIDLTASWMIGDILDDVAAGRAAGCRTILLSVGSETEWVVDAARCPDYVVPNLYLAACAIARERAAGARSRGWVS